MSDQSMPHSTDETEATKVATPDSNQDIELAEDALEELEALEGAGTKFNR